MNKINRFIAHLRYHQTLINVFLVLLVLSAVALYIIYSGIQSQFNVQYQKTFEKKSLSQLEIYHFGSGQLVSEFYGNNLSLVELLSKQPHFVEAVNSGNAQEVQEILDLYRSSNKNLTSLGVVSSLRKLLYFSSVFPNGNKSLGTILPERDYITRPVLTKLPTVGQVVISTGTGLATQTFSAPIFSKDGQVHFILTASMTLDRLSEATTLTSKFGSFDSILVDQKGNTLLENSKAPKTVASLKGKEKIIDNLLAGAKLSQNEEINYKDKKVFAMGSRIDLGFGNQLYLVSFYPKSEFAQDLDAFKAEFDRIFLSLLVWVYLIVIIAYISVIWLVKRHELLVSNRQGGTKDEI